MTEEQIIYPRGQVALGNGDLLDVVEVSIDTTDNSKQVHTIRRKGGGDTQGVEETTVNFKAVVGEDGEEADWLKKVKKSAIDQLRLKIPGRTITVNGKFSTANYSLPLDDAIMVDVTMVGHIVD